MISDRILNELGSRPNAWCSHHGRWCPGAISVLASYDAERRYIPDRARADQYVPRGAGKLLGPDLPYSHGWFPPPRWPRLASHIGIRTAILLKSFDAISRQLRPQVDALTRNAPTFGQTQNIWYAVAPLLLDSASSDSIRWIGEFAGRRERSGKVPMMPTVRRCGGIWPPTCRIGWPMHETTRHPWVGRRTTWWRGWRCWP